MPRPPDPRRPYLLVPGPTEVHPDVARAATEPMIGHRGPEARALLADVLPRVGRWIGAAGTVLPLGCSATGAMEASVRNAAPGPFLHLVAGAFSERWSAVRAACGLEGDELRVPWGSALRPEAVREALGRRRYSAVTFVHNETSTGVLHPLPEIAATVAGFDDVLLLVDTVSSMAATPVEVDAWGVDVCFAGVQKAWALPAGLTLCSVSARAIERARTAPARGWYLDWVRLAEAIARWETPSTPPLSILLQLRAQLDRMDAEGPGARFRRHLDLRDRVLDFARGRLEPFAEAGYRSPALTALHAGGHDVAAVRRAMRSFGWDLAGGYGLTRDSALRIGHMGEMTAATLDLALADLDRCLRGPTELVS